MSMDDVFAYLKKEQSANIKTNPGHTQIVLTTVRELVSSARRKSIQQVIF